MTTSKDYSVNMTLLLNESINVTPISTPLITSHDNSKFKWNNCLILFNFLKRMLEWK